MYSRNYRPGENRKEGNVPVQFFGDSFSASAFMKNENKKTEENKYEMKAQDFKEREEKQSEISENNECADNKIRESEPKANTEKPRQRGFDIDDMLLAGLILLFLADTDKSEDLLIPALLAIVLLF